VEAEPEKDLRTLLGNELEDTLAELAKPSAGESILRAAKTLLSFVRLNMSETGGFSFDMDLSGIHGSNASTGNLPGDLGRLVRDLSEVQEKAGKGVALFIDEAQDLPIEELRAVNMLAHRSGQERYRLVIVVAGLPTLPGKLADANSYAERLYAFSELRELDETAVKTALAEPAAAKGVEWEESAVAQVCAETKGFSYFVQEYGSAAWETAQKSPIRKDDVLSAKDIALTGLDSGFFKSRWDRASDAQKAYLRAMAVDYDQPSRTNQIAERLGVKPIAVSPRRAELIAKGLIYSPQHGYVAFTVPQMADFINRQPE
jgi:hypothetical protein